MIIWDEDGKPEPFSRRCAFSRSWMAEMVPHRTFFRAPEASDFWVVRLKVELR